MKVVDLPPLATLAGEAMSFHQCRFDVPEHSLDRLDTTGFQLLLPSTLARAVPKRQAEFLAGRYCAHRTAALLQYPLDSLTIRQDRSPDWPAALVGSITHTTGIAGCLTGFSNHYRGLGLDMEWLVSATSAEALRSQIVTETDLRLLCSMADEREGLTLMFSAKEAIYKAIHPTVQRYVDFKEVFCEARYADHLLFGCEPALKAELAGIDSIRVNYQITAGLVTTWCILV